MSFLRIEPRQLENPNLNLNRNPKIAKLGSEGSSESLNCAKSIGVLILLELARRLLGPPVPQYRSRDAAAAAAAACASGSGAAGRAEARVGHPAAVEARSWGPLGGNSWIEGFNPTPALNRRGGPLRTPAGGKFEFEPNEG